MTLMRLRRLQGRCRRICEEVESPVAFAREASLAVRVTIRSVAFARRASLVMRVVATRSAAAASLVGFGATLGAVCVAIGSCSSR